MSQKRIQQIERRIDRIKRALLEIGPMRPGSCSTTLRSCEIRPQHVDLHFIWEGTGDDAG